MTNDIKSEEKGTSHSSDVTSSCFSRLFGSEADALFHHIHKLQGSLNAEVARANVWLGWVWQRYAGELVVCCWTRIVLDQDIKSFAMRRELCPHPFFFLFHSPLSISTPSSLPPSISSPLTEFISHKACLYYLLSCGSRLHPSRGQVGIRTGSHSVLNYSRASKTASTTLWSLPEWWLFHFGDSCFAPG